MRLIRPTRALKAQFLEMAADFHAAGEDRADKAAADFDAYLEMCRAHEAGECEGLVAQTHFWLVDEGDRVLGTCRVRHHLSEALWHEGGHIGYDVRPSARGRGHATRMLGIALEEALALGLSWVLITVDESNAASRRVVEKNGGAWLDRVPGTTVLRYCIDLVPPELAEEGVVAVGGDVTPEDVLAAYRRGVFPWPVDEDMPMVWWSPDPRFVLYPGELHVSRSLEQRVRSDRFEVLLDTEFEQVIDGCTRPEGWITPEIRRSYVSLFGMGYAHCAEAWQDGELVGGLYGIAMGRVFFGESMFARVTDASKVAFVRLVRQLEAWGFAMVDCQQETPHLARFGARAIPRARFLAELQEFLKHPNRPAPWRFDPA